MSGISDLEIYQRFTALAAELDRMAARGPSLVGGAALNTAVRSLRGMASAIYEHSLAATDEDSTPQ